MHNPICYQGDTCFEVIPYPGMQNGNTPPNPKSDIIDNRFFPIVMIEGIYFLLLLSSLHVLSF